MSAIKAILSLLLFLAAASLSASLGPVVSIDNYQPPAGWDNIGVGLAGQTFVAQDVNFYGVHVNIGDPAGPASRGPLAGPADLVLMDAANLLAPVELARFRFISAGTELLGVYDILLPAPIPTTIGHTYFFGIDTADQFGLALADGSSSTYSGGAEAFYSAGALTLAGSGRDFSFRIYKEGSSSAGSVFISIDHLFETGIYDNQGDGLSGQTFLATSQNFFGVRLFIGKPGGPVSLSSLIGPADLVLMDAASLDSPVEIERFEVVPAGVELEGVFDFILPVSIPTQLGHRYFVGIDAADFFGIGLVNGTSSTYPDGEQAFFINGVLVPAGNNRDLTFRIYSREPGIVQDAFLTVPLCRSASFTSGVCRDASPAVSLQPMTAVLDHFGNYQDLDGIVKAFRTDLGCASPPCVGSSSFGTHTAGAAYRQDCSGTPINFSGQLDYVGLPGIGGLGSCPGGSTSSTSYLGSDGHSGYDFDTDYGDVILAAAAGYLDAPVGPDPILGANAEFFHALRIRHYNGAETWYLHAQPGTECALAGLCTPGERKYVNARQAIALAGNTGLGCGTCTAGSCPCAHLHFELRAADSPIDSIDPFACASDVLSLDLPRCPTIRLWLEGSLFRDDFESGDTSAWQ